MRVKALKLNAIGFAGAGRAIAIAVAMGLTLEGLCSALPARAQAASQSPNPLESKTADPLLPQPPVARPLSSSERRQLVAALDELNAQATAQWQSGNADEAFAIWYRELRLRRALGPIEEVQALGRVGEVAWSENRRTDVQLITQRLETIQQQAEVESQLDPELLTVLGEAYQQVRAPRPALSIYQQMLADARQRKDLDAQEQLLLTIAQLHLAWFEYPQAAETYEQLVDLARSRSDYLAQVSYLQELAEIYTQAEQPANGVRIKQNLAQQYRTQQQLESLASLLVSLAADYAAIDQPERASQTYQEAFQLAWSQQQFAIAGEALEQLGNLYRTYEQPGAALQIYLELIKVRQQVYDFYGLMNAYDKIGQIYREQSDYAQALEAFQTGLEIAQSLGYQEVYFANQIEQVSQQMNGQL